MDIKAILGSSYKEGMTVEELTAALEAAELPTEQQLRDSITRVTKENAEKKREIKVKDGTIEGLQAQLTALQRENAIGKHTSAFLSLGYGQEAAELAATALADGDAAALLEQQKKFQEGWMAAQKAELMRNTPAPAAGNGSTGAVDYAAKAQAAQLAGDIAAAAYYTRLAGQQASE